ncbi:MAG: hypothetical protein ACLRUZ_11800 [Faecalimonas sp.]
MSKLKPKGDLVYPLSQHIGAPANPIVADRGPCFKGTDELLRQEDLYLRRSMLLCPERSKAIAPHLNPTGAKVNSIVIENDERV